MGDVGVAHLLPQLLERGQVGVIPVNVTQELVELVEGGRIEAAVFFETVAGPLAELVEVPVRLGDADHRHVQAAAFDQRLQRGKDLLVGEIAGGAEEDKHVGTGCGHQVVTPGNGRMKAEG